MTEQLKSLLFYIAVSKGGRTIVDKTLIEKMKKQLEGNYNKELVIKNLKDNGKVLLVVEDKKIPPIVFQEIIGYLNQRAGTNFRWNTNKAKTAITARIAEGYTVPDFEKVIDNKVTAWKNDKKMRPYLRPETLFGPKFEAYLNEQPVREPGEITSKPSFDLSKIKEDARNNTEIKGL